MTSPQLTNSSLVTFTFGDGDCETVITQTSTDLDHEPMPLSTADYALLFDFNGVKKIINLSGRLTLATSSRTDVGTTLTIDAQRKWLEANLNGNQSGLTFISNYSSVYDGSTWIPANVFMSNITFTEITGEPNSLQFQISLFIGDV